MTVLEYGSRVEAGHPDAEMWIRDNLDRSVRKIESTGPGQWIEGPTVWLDPDINAWCWYGRREVSDAS